ncbi:MAG: UDP-4-amino-4,6-dideoxy-N-acetyl-beta-L-altrosamine transaminase [Bacteroidetes bacterium]|nr:UDP-4-amino-4,6-dideoxy-N-acetyl-beta-L-altrosamine transaminase [Bacteroidota bacterium]
MNRPEEPFGPIPYGRQHIEPQDIEAVERVLGSDYLTQGPEIERFERSFAEYVGSEYAVAVSNGTAALHLCALALNVSEGDRVITSPITFSASANCVRYCGGDIVFADIDPDTYLLDIQKVKELLQSSPSGSFAGIIPIDFAGRAVNMEAFRELADEYGLWIIEDSCHAPGGFFTDSKGQRRFCGNGDFADLAIFSFHPVKHIAAGEGGMITTDNQQLYRRLLDLRTHGIVKDEKRYHNPSSTAFGSQVSGGKEGYPGWYMEMQELGYNYRLTDFQAALGNSQLRRAKRGLEKRRSIARRYAHSFDGKAYIQGQSGVVEGHAYHLYVIEVDDRLGLYNHLRERKIYTQVHYIPVHLMPYYRQQGWSEGDFPHAELYYSRCLSLPIYPTLSEGQQEYVLECIEEYYDG